jgi:hypothetical protein
MSDTWQRHGDRRLVIRSGNPIGRYLIGAPFLLTGAWFLWKYLVLGIAEYARAGDWRGLASNPFGWLVVILMGSVFFVPGWLLCFFRRVVLVDLDSAALLERKDFRVFRRDTRHDLKAFNRIVVLEEPVKNSARTLHGVYLYRADESNVIAAVMDREPEATALAEALCGLLGLEIISTTQRAWQDR